MSDNELDIQSSQDSVDSLQELGEKKEESIGTEGNISMEIHNLETKGSKKKKRVLTQKQLDNLAKARVKAAEKRKQNAELKRKEKETIKLEKKNKQKDLEMRYYEAVNKLEAYEKNSVGTAQPRDTTPVREEVVAPKQTVVATPQTYAPPQETGYVAPAPYVKPVNEMTDDELTSQIEDYNINSRIMEIKKELGQRDFQRKMKQLNLNVFPEF